MSDSESGQRLSPGVEYQILNIQDEKFPAFLKGKHGALLPAEQISEVLPVLFEGNNFDIQPHGVDLPVSHFIDLTVSTELGYSKPSPTEGLVPFTPTEVAPGVVLDLARLEPGHRYIPVLSTKLKKPLKEVPYQIELYPKSTLLRIGVETGHNSTPGLDTDHQQVVRKFLPEWDSKRSLALQTLFRVVNNCGIEIERGAPLVQATIRSEGNAGPFKRSKYELTLGKVLDFQSHVPRLTKDKQHRIVKITTPLESQSGFFRLQKGRPYLARSRETLEVGANEQISLFGRVDWPGVEHWVTGEALADAGYQGPAHYLLVPDHDMSVEVGERLSHVYVEQANVTSKLYNGTWVANNL